MLVFVEPKVLLSYVTDMLSQLGQKVLTGYNKASLPLGSRGTAESEAIYWRYEKYHVMLGFKDKVTKSDWGDTSLARQKLQINGLNIWVYTIIYNQNIRYHHPPFKIEFPSLIQKKNKHFTFHARTFPCNKNTYNHRTESSHVVMLVSLEPVGLDHFPSPRWRPPGSRLPKAWFWCCSDTPRWWHCHKSTPGSFGNPMIAGGGWEEWWALEKLENTKSIRDSSHINIYHKKSARHKSSS